MWDFKVRGERVWGKRDGLGEPLHTVWTGNALL